MAEITWDCSMYKKLAALGVVTHVTFGWLVSDTIKKTFNNVDKVVIQDKVLKFTFKNGNFVITEIKMTSDGQYYYESHIRKSVDSVEPDEKYLNYGLEQFSNHLTKIQDCLDKVNNAKF